MLIQSVVFANSAGGTFKSRLCRKAGIRSQSKTGKCDENLHCDR